MVDVTTSGGTALRLPANDTVLDAPVLTNQQERRRRILAIRERIESGEYRVSASDVADAILRKARSAN